MPKVISKKGKKTADVSKKRLRSEDGAKTQIPKTAEKNVKTTLKKQKTETLPAAKKIPINETQKEKQKQSTMMGDIEIKRNVKIFNEEEANALLNGSKDQSSTISAATVVKGASNKQKCLAFGTRGITAKERHFLKDLIDMNPHFREHGKVNVNDKYFRNSSSSLSTDGTTMTSLGAAVTELADLHHCNTVLFIESHHRHSNDNNSMNSSGNTNHTSYLWMAQTSPMNRGPSMKFQLNSIHTADEIKMIGNSIKYSRPLLHFDKEFDTLPQLRIARSLLVSMFNIPRYHQRSKPFIDHIVCFFWLDEHIWFRNYQIIISNTSNENNGFIGKDKKHQRAPEALTLTKHSSASLLEIGPRFTLFPAVILNDVCSGNVLYKNPLFESSTEKRRNRKEMKMHKFMENQEIVQKLSEEHKQKALQALKKDPLADVFK